MPDQMAPVPMPQQQMAPSSRPRYPTNPNAAPRTTGVLFPGAVLQNGRYRILGLYGPNAPQEGRSNSGYRQWVAVDGMRRVGTI
jgi:hypothetical protein